MWNISELLYCNFCRKRSLKSDTVAESKRRTCFGAIPALGTWGLLLFNAHFTSRDGLQKMLSARPVQTDGRCSSAAVASQLSRINNTPTVRCGGRRVALARDVL